MITRICLALLLTAGLLGAATPSTQGAGDIRLASGEDVVIRLPAGTTHVALEWPAEAEPELWLAFSDEGRAFGPRFAVPHDERTGAATAGSGVIWTAGARYLRLVAGAPVDGLSVVPIAVGGSVLPHGSASSDPPPTIDQPAVIRRADWGANESWRFDAEGTPLWPEEFFEIQKLVVHHTAGRNDDPDPAATVRAIQHYQAITRGWGDVGYNFLIDEQGRVYEGRYSREYAAEEIPTGADAEGNGVQGAHVAHHNSGTVGIALLGNLVDQDATPQARRALEWLLAWLSQLHGLDPEGEGLYVNPHPEGTTQREVPNISGHRDWAATECPGGIFYATLPALRGRVAQWLAGQPTPEPPPEPPAASVPEAPQLSAATPPRAKGVRLTWTVPPDGGSALTAYRVLRVKKGSFVRVATLGPATTTWRDRNTRPGRSYTYAVRAVNAVGTGPRSNEATAVAR